jgi:hypothetical protein
VAMGSGSDDAAGLGGNDVAGMERAGRRHVWSKYKGPVVCPQCQKSVGRATLKRHQQSRQCQRASSRLDSSVA